MILIIDGYNLLRHIFPKVKGHLDEQRKQIKKMKMRGFQKKIVSRLKIQFIIGNRNMLICLIIFQYFM